MKKRKLGKTDLNVSEIGLGCWQLGGLSIINDVSTTYGDVDESTAYKIVETALEMGINTFDTADSYSQGNSEKRLGNIFKECRDEVYIFTKAGNILSNNTSTVFEINLSSDYLISSLAKSLVRLQTDYVDLFQAHKAPQSEEDFVHLENAFTKIKASSMARFCGVSIGREYEKGIDLIERGIVDSLQLYFSLIDFESSEILFSLAQKNNVGIIVAEPLCQGFLTGKYRSGFTFPKTDVRSGIDVDTLNGKIKKTNEFLFLENNKRSLSQNALSYVLSYDEVSTCIPGAKSIDHIKQNCQASEFRLNEDELKKISFIQKNW